MPINVYTGLMRSGKSYEVVSEVIVPAIRSGRRVVTNVDGISQEKIHEYLSLKYPHDNSSKYGLILHVDNTQVFQEDFFPFYDDHKGSHTNTIVQPGDLVCIDEAWRFWGASDCKIHKNHKSFFLEHGHFTNEETNIACDLVLMIQDMGTLNRFVKNVVAFNFRTHKKVSLGMGNTYSLTMWEGNKQAKSSQIGNWVRRYNKEIFPLYSSFKGGTAGVMVNADSRQNIFTNKKIWFGLVFFIVVAVFSVRNIYKFFNPNAPVKKGADGKPLVINPASPGVASGALPGVVALPVFSESWRVTGSFSAFGKTFVVLTNSNGVVRFESPSMFSNSGLSQVGTIDGSRVTPWSGSSTSRPSVLQNAVPQFPQVQK